MGEQLDYVKVGDKDYAVIKTGRAQAEQALRITRWITKYGLPAVAGAAKDGEVKAESTMAFLGVITESLTADAVIDLFAALVGCSREESEAHFDIGTLIDVAVEVYNRQPSIRRVLDRFFSTQGLEEGLPE